MNILIISVLLVIAIAIVTTLIIIAYKIEKTNKQNVVLSLQDVLELKGFFAKEIVYVNKYLSVALNNNFNKIALIRNFNPKSPTYFDYMEIALSFIEKIEKGVYIKLWYIKRGENKSLKIYPINNEVKDFFHKIYLKACINRIESKFSQVKFSDFSSSDWESSYVWAYSKRTNEFAYLKTTDKSMIFKINLKREHFTIDTKYRYFEAPVFGMPQQLSTYEYDFLNNLFDSMLHSIKSKCGTILENAIYYDNFNNIVYLTNGTTSLQSVDLDKIEEVFYRDNRISFSLANEQKVINFTTNPQFIAAFEDFMTNYNLKKIAQNFDYKSDKLINVTESTKFIADISRDRMVYCANLNKLASFSYLTIMFQDIYDVKIEKSGLKYFVRITTKNKDIIDVSCDKKEVAQYIEGLIVKTLG